MAAVLQFKDSRVSDRPPSVTLVISSPFEGTRHLLFSFSKYEEEDSVLVGFKIGYYVLLCS